MLALILILAGAAPRALPGAEVVSYLPRLDRTADSVPFFEVAGARVSLLRPSAWREFTHPILEFDVTRAESFNAAGIDGTGSLTVSRRGEFEVSCVTLSDVKAFETACAPRMKSTGDLTRKTEAGVTIVSAKDQLNRVLLAYALKGKVSCAATNHGLSLQEVLPELAKLTASTKPPTGAGYKAASDLPGAISIIRPDGPQSGAVSLTTKNLTATLNAQINGLVSALAPKVGQSPFATAAPLGMAVLRLRLTKGAALEESLAAALKQVPGGRLLQPAVHVLAPLMTGNVLVFVHRAEVTGSLGTDDARFRALKHAILIETTDAAATTQALAELAARDPSGRRPVSQFGSLGSVAYLFNDDLALKTALTSLEGAAAAGRQAHSLEIRLEPGVMAKALAQVPLLDAIQNQALAGLLAVGSELGPLLLVSEPMTGWVDPPSAPTGAHRAQVVWPLKAP